MCLLTPAILPQTPLAKLANARGPEMTVIGRSPVSQWLCQCHYEWKWKLLNPEMTHMAKPLS